MAQDELQKLINLISRLPGVGQRSAQRIALYLIKNKQELMLPLGESIKETAAKVRKCEICGMLDVNLPTKICSSDTRIKNTICICLLYTSPSPRDAHESRMPSSA